MTRKKKFVIAASIVALLAVGLWILIWPIVEAEMRLRYGIGLPEITVETIHPTGTVREVLVEVGFDRHIPTQLGERDGPIIEQRFVTVPLDVQVDEHNIILPHTDRVEFHFITRKDNQWYDLEEVRERGVQRSIIESRRTGRLHNRRVNFGEYTGQVIYNYPVRMSEMDVQIVRYAMVAEDHIAHFRFVRPDPNVFTYDMYDTFVATVLSGLDWETFKRQVD